MAHASNPSRSAYLPLGATLIALLADRAARWSLVALPSGEDEKMFVHEPMPIG
ncbi:MAG TPA: hypothetical protein VJV79_35955 [Polyangiaceae bacterium]|nr:hypothetical protein [Polyangiaceae bacterium]